MSVDRRTVVTSAWAVPVLAVVSAAPTASASGTVPDGEENYHWAAESSGQYTSLVAAASGLRAQFSTQIAYRAEPWMEPPEAATLRLTILFDRPVTMAETTSEEWLTASTSPGTEFVFDLAPSGFGGAFTATITADTAGPLTSDAFMSVANGGSVSWDHEHSSGSAELLA